jgi:Mn-dependent DtxR family transcriptional regulator
MTNVTLKDKLFDSFYNPVRNTVTVAQAAARYQVAPSTVIKAVRQLRLEGVAIYTNTKTLEDGRKIHFYRKGKPSKRYLRNLRAGRTEIAIASLVS